MADIIGKCIVKKKFVNTDTMIASFDVRFVDNNSSWDELTDAREKFPNRGRLFRSLKNDSAVIKQLEEYVLFFSNYSENFNVDKNDPNKDLYYAENIKPLIPILDIPANWNNDFDYIRKHITQLPVVLNEPKVFLAFHSLYLKVKKTEEQNERGITCGHYELETMPNDNVTVKTYTIPENQQIYCDGEYYCLDSDAVEQSTCFYAGDDTAFIKFITKRFRDFSAQQNILLPVHEALEKLVSIASFFDDHVSQYDSEYLKQRIAILQQDFSADSNINAAVFDTVKNSTSFKQKIEQELSICREKQKTALEEELESLYSQRDALHADSKKLEAQIETQKQEHAHLQAEADRNMTECQRKHELVSKKITAEIHRLRQCLAAVSPAEFPHAQAFAERMEQYLGQTQAQLLPSVCAPWHMPHPNMVDQVILEKEVSSALDAAASMTGHDGSVLKHLDGFTRAGEMPFLFGEGSQSHLQQYADVVSGGALYRMDADPSTLSLDDLWRVPGSQLPTSFAMAWTVASCDGQFHLVQINIEESPCHLWIKPLFDVLHAAMRPRTLLVVLTCGHLQRDIDAKQWLPYVVPLECPAASMGGGHWSLSTMDPDLIEDNVQKKYAMDRGLALARFAPALAVDYPSWPTSVEQDSLLDTSQKNIPF